jgi:hypothetical protein
VKSAAFLFCLSSFLFIPTYSFADGYAGSTKDFFDQVKGCQIGNNGYEVIGVITGTYFGMNEFVFYNKPHGAVVEKPKNILGVIHAGGGDSSFYPIFCGRERGFLKIGDYWVNENQVGKENIVPINKWIERLGKENYISSPTQIKTKRGRVTVESGYFNILGDSCTKDGICYVNYWETHQPLCTEGVIKTPPMYSGEMQVFDKISRIPLFHDIVSDSSFVCEVKLLEDAVLNLDDGETRSLKKGSHVLVYCWDNACEVYEEGYVLESRGSFSPFNKDGKTIIEMISTDAGILGC